MPGTGVDAARVDESDAPIAALLRSAGLVEDEGLERARQFQRLHGGLLGDAILRLELCKESDFLRVFAEIYSTRFVKADKLATLKIEDSLLERLKVRECERLRVCPFRWDAARGEMHVVAAVPISATLNQELKSQTGARSVLTYIASSGAVSALIRRWHYRETSAFLEMTPNGAGPLPSLPKPEVSDEQSAKTQAQGSLELLVQSLRRENARFRAAQEFSRRVTLERSLEAMIERILNVLFELLPAETAAIALANGKEVIKVRREGLVADVPNSVLERALQSDRGLLVNNALIDQRFGRSESVMIRGIKSVMAVPLKARDRTLGVLYVDSVSQSAAFGEDDLPLLESIAGQAAMFLDNASLIAEVASEVEKRLNLSRFLSPAAVEEVLSGRTDLKLDGQSAQVTVLFADIRGFTRATANMPPEAVVRFLNGFFSEMVEAVEANGGVVDKFIGDAVMALWGAPEPKVDDARNALRGAINMLQRAASLEFNGEPLEIGIGVHTGNAVLGSIGSKRRLDYTAIGSTVNLASRLCSLAQPGEVLTLQDTLQLAGPNVRADATRPTKLKGYDQSVVPYAVKSVDLLEVSDAQGRPTSLETTHPRIPMSQAASKTWPGTDS